jgi:hypothetical protein
VPYWMERLDEHYEYMHLAVPLMKKMPSEYMRGQQVYYSFEPDEQTLPFIMEFVGEDRLVLRRTTTMAIASFPTRWSR